MNFYDRSHSSLFIDCVDNSNLGRMFGIETRTHTCMKAPEMEKTGCMREAVSSTGNEVTQGQLLVSPSDPTVSMKSLL